MPMVSVDLEELCLGRDDNEILSSCHNDINTYLRAKGQTNMSLTSSACIAAMIFSIVSGEIRTVTHPLSSQSSGCVTCRATLGWQQLRLRSKVDVLSICTEPLIHSIPQF